MDILENDHLRKGIDVLEDIQKLSDADISPFIEQAFYFFSEAARDRNSSESLVQLPNIEKFLQDNLRSVLDHFFMKNKSLKQLNLSINVERGSLQLWDTLLEIITPVLYVADLFAYQGRVSIEVDCNGIEIKGMIPLKNVVSQYREKIYQANRLLLKNRTLFTYELSENSDEEDLLNFTLKARIDSEEGNGFCIDLEKKHQMFLWFSPLVKNYISSYEEVLEKGGHYCIEITENLQVRTYNKIPGKELIDYTDRELLHFSFIFRPVSIIIPKRGKIFPCKNLRQNGVTGSEESIAQIQDVLSPQHSDSSRSYYIDLISLFTQN